MLLFSFLRAIFDNFRSLRVFFVDIVRFRTLYLYMEKRTIFGDVLKSIKDSFVWVLGGEPYAGKQFIDLNPDNNVASSENASPLNWTRIIIFLLAFLTLSFWFMPLIRSFIKKK